MNYRFLPPALAEIREAAAFYEEIVVVSVFHQSREPRSWREAARGPVP